MSHSPSASQPKNEAGSLTSGEPAFLVVCRVRRVHGLRGELLMEVLTDFPERLQVGLVVYAGREHKPYHIQSLRPHGQGLLVAFDELNSSEQAKELRDQFIFVRAEDRPPLPEGEYYHHQLLGLKVIGDNGQIYGIVKEILTTGANDVLVVLPPSGNDILLPVIPEVVRHIDLVTGEVHVSMLPGLISS